MYAHILDEDRKINAQKFESAFYANPDLRLVRPPEEPEGTGARHIGFEALVEQLRNSPELANTLAALLASAPSEKIGRENRISKSAFLLARPEK